MKHITVLKFRYSNEQSYYTRNYNNGADAERWLENKIRSLKLYNPTYTIECHSFNKEITS